jgi:hypothetical protein
VGAGAVAVGQVKGRWWQGGLGVEGGGRDSGAGGVERGQGGRHRQGVRKVGQCHESDVPLSFFHSPSLSHSYFGYGH